MQPLRRSYTNRTLGDGATVVKCYQAPVRSPGSGMSALCWTPCRGGFRCRRSWVLGVAA